MAIKSIDISGGVSTIAWTDGTVRTYDVNGYDAMLRCRARRATWNVPAASGRASDTEELAAEIMRMAEESR